jgi:hypothetical protein
MAGRTRGSPERYGLVLMQLASVRESWYSNSEHESMGRNVAAISRESISEQIHDAV